MTKTGSWKLILVLMLFPASAFAQLPFSAGYKPVVDASVGYSYVSIPIPSSSRMNMNGLEASFAATFRSRFGAKIDLDYVRASNVLGSGRHSDVLTYMLGPVYYPINTDRLTVYIQALAGYSRIDGVVPDGAGGFNVAFTTRGRSAAESSGALLHLSRYDRKRTICKLHTPTQPPRLEAKAI